MKLIIYYDRRTNLELEKFELANYQDPAEADDMFTSKRKINVLNNPHIEKKIFSIPDDVNERYKAKKNKYNRNQRNR